MSALASLPLPWLLARASGLVAFGMLTASVWLGLATSTRILGTRHQARVFAWHRTLAWAGLAMLLLHGGSLLLDPTIHFGLPSVLVPFAAPWRPVAVAAGVVAGWLALALAASFHLKKHIGHRGWRRLHYASFAAFVLALGHALFSGTDLSGIGGPILAVIAATPVLSLTLVRILVPRAAAARRAAPGPARAASA